MILLIVATAVFLAFALLAQDVFYGVRGHDSHTRDFLDRRAARARRRRVEARYAGGRSVGHVVRVSRDG